MATTLTYGLVKPVTGDPGSTWFPAIEGDITQLDAHNHDGANSAQLTNSGIATGAAITRSKLATGTAYRILANTSAGVISENAALTSAHVVYADTNGQLAGEANLAISRGGTNAGTAIAGFNNLCPFTTKGDQLGSNGSTAARIAVGTDGQVWTADSASTNGVKWATATAAPTQSYEIANVGFATSVGASALTVTLKQADGTAPSTGAGALKFGFRNSTTTTGQYAQQTITSATAGATITVASTATLGFSGGSAVNYAYLYAIDVAGTVELGICGIILDEGTLQSSTILNASSTSNTVLYSTTARASRAVRLIGRIKFTLAVAGTWDEAGDELSVAPFNVSKFPTIQAFTSGSAATYTKPAGCTWIRVRMVGGGGGGGGSGTNTGGTIGGDGGNSLFGTTLLVANGGGGGTLIGTGQAAGGTASLGTGPIGVAISGGTGGGTTASSAGSSFGVGGASGAASPFGGAGAGGARTINGSDAAANTGSGGGGGGTDAANSVAGGGGGAAGGYVDAIITNPAATYTYTVGAAGAAGTAAGSGHAGGAGAAGRIIVEEHYN